MTSSGATPRRRPASSPRCPRSRWPRSSRWWILTGTLERFPRLKIVFVEPSLYWIPGFLAGLDRKAAGGYDFPGVKMKPERVLPPQHGVHLHGRRGRAEPAPPRRRREHPVVDRLPPPGDHVAELAEIVDRQFADIPDDERELICCRQLRPHLRPLMARRRTADDSRRTRRDHRRAPRLPATGACCTACPAAGCRGATSTWTRRIQHGRPPRRQGFVIVLIDHPGVGDSPAPADPWTLTPKVVAEPNRGGSRARPASAASLSASVIRWAAC